ncbi:sulfatase [Flavobacteriaceae bacterium]|nr:sulfatase [Flavobacteriaceae bacterium]
MRLLKIKTAVIYLLFLGLCSCKQAEIKSLETAKTNFIVIFADDLGYGDLSSFGHPSIKTPHLDQMAIEGQRWTNFYVASSVCTPSRAALLTGRLPFRSGMTNVLFSNSKDGIPQKEITLAEQLKTAGYATACIGKWHLGDQKKFLPTEHGFDYYFGIPYSNDMDLPEWVNANGTNYWKFWNDPKNLDSNNFNVPLLRNTEVIERPANQTTLTQRYTEETSNFIKENKNQPFFIYLAHTMPHVPLFASEAFSGKSDRGLYGDVVEEIDYNVGQILSTLKKEGLAENTLVVFTSDNGPWKQFKENGGSAGPLKGGKGSTWEGGVRVPTIFWSPKKIKKGMVTHLGTTMDLFPTFSRLAGIPIPTDRKMDGYDLSPSLFQFQKNQRESVYYYRGENLFAIRNGKYKAHFITKKGNGFFGGTEIQNPPLLYDLSSDPSEKYPLKEANPEVLKKMNELKARHQ